MSPVEQRLGAKTRFKTFEPEERTFFDFRQPDVFWLKGPGLDIVQEFSNFNHIVDYAWRRVRIRADEEFACTYPVDLESLLARDRIDPYKGILQMSQQGFRRVRKHHLPS